MTNETIDPRIAEKLKAIRLSKSLTQLELAGKAGINANYYSKVERGEAVPSLATFEKILKALKVKSSDVLPY